MKKIIAGFLCLLMCVSVSSMAIATNVRDITTETLLAGRLEAVGLFLGAEKNEDGTPNFDLSRAPSRVEALTMLVRALGKGTEVVSVPKTHPFSDVPTWADGVVSYANQNDLTNGVSDTLFGAGHTATAETYLTFLLRALGYSDGPDGDFTWDAPWALAAQSGIVPITVNRTNFLRADVVNTTCAALFAHIKGTQTTLWEQLVLEGAFTKEQFERAFSTNPFVCFGTRYSTYKEAIGARSESYVVEQRLEAELCTIQLGCLVGTPRGTLVSLDVAYKPGSVMGEGVMVLLPTPDEHGMGLTYSYPEDLHLSEDGFTLYYSYHYDEPLVLGPGLPSERVVHEAGIYSYTVNLNTGVAALDIRPRDTGVGT